jgi:hypothetical protein
LQSWILFSKKQKKHKIRKRDETFQNIAWYEYVFLFFLFAMAYFAIGISIDTTSALIYSANVSNLVHC